jgi:hypothetical protein
MSLNHFHFSHLVNGPFQSINQDRSIRNGAEAEERAWGTINRRQLRGDRSLEAVAAERYLFARLTAVRKLRSGYLAVRKARASANVREPNQTAVFEAESRVASGRLFRVDIAAAGAQRAMRHPTVRIGLLLVRIAQRAVPVTGRTAGTR